MGDGLERPTLRVLVVDDYERWRAFVASTLQKEPQLQIIGEGSDGFEAVQIAQQLQPDLIVLDIGLPRLNGIEAARRIREVSPNSRILFVSENRSRDIAEDAMSTGAWGYVVKAAAATELLPAVNAVLQGKQFLSASLTGPALHEFENPPTSEQVIHAQPQYLETPHRHEVGFYSDDHSFLGDVTHFIGSALRTGNAAIVVATESHRESILAKLQAQGLNIDEAIERKRYIPLDVAETLSTFLVQGRPNPVRFMETFDNVLLTAAKAAIAESRIAVYGECAPVLWAQGNPEAAIQFERLSNRLTHACDVDILCGYSQGTIEGEMDAEIFRRICAEHSAIYSR